MGLIEDSTPKVSSELAIVILILSIICPGVGTIVAGVTTEEKDKSQSALIVGIIQLCTCIVCIDYSHTTTLSLVSKEWFLIANSNQLWEFYFHKLTNNSMKKLINDGIFHIRDDLLSDRVNIEELFWKEEVRYHLTSSLNYTSKDSDTLSYSFLKETFPNAFSSQLIKTILHRIYFMEPTPSYPRLSLPTFTMKLLIAGIEESFIVRGIYYNNEIKRKSAWKIVDSKGYFLYIAKESDDLKNDSLFKTNSEMTDELADQLKEGNRCFLYRITNRKDGGSLIGADYLENNILTYLVPTVKSYELSPKEFIPYFCLIINIRLSKGTGSIHTNCGYRIHQIFANFFPNFISNSLIFNFLKKFYKSKVQKIAQELTERFKCFTPKDVDERNVFTSFILKKDLKPQKKGHVQRLDLTELGLTLQKYSKLFASLCENENSAAKMSAKSRWKYISKIQDLCSNLDEFTEFYLRYKFNKYNSVKLP